MRYRVITSLATTAVLAAAAAGVGAPAGADTPSLKYVALGDSYSSAPGVFPIDWSAPQCGRSLVNYGHVIAAANAADYTDVTCGGAQTKDFTQSQFPGTAPQLDAVTADTDLVTMTIGGNDNNTLANAIAACGSVGVFSGGFGSPCKNLYGNTFTTAVKTKTYPAVRDAIARVKTKAPNAQIAILGYPWVLPPTKGCYPVVPLASGDVPYLRDLQATLNGVIAQAAADNGATFVDFSVASEGHDVCQKDGVRWIDGILGTTSPIHPNALGEAQMAFRTMQVLDLS